jgi:hypothetical protein
VRVHHERYSVTVEAQDCSMKLTPVQWRELLAYGMARIELERTPRRNTKAPVIPRDREGFMIER